MKKEMAKNYNPKDFESRIYDAWENSGAFAANVNPDKTPYTISMPPPNITGQLHMGHALDQTLQDVLIRWKRMQGFEALWLPGSDHASIATEVKVADKIREEEGKTKEELGREEFLKRAWAWKHEYGNKITEQVRKLGNSCDWSKERFTMDDGCNKAVVETFIRLYEKGLIYRGNRMINWCPDCGTSLSDAEVEHEDREGKYYYFRYPGKDGGDGIVVATSRPETMFGDVAIAVNPEDERYKDMIGKEVLIPVIGTAIPVISDPYPDPEKGTGAVKITPAHDPNDYEVGERQNLEQICCINDDATMNKVAGKYEGLDRYECRRRWVKELDDNGFMVKVEDKVIPTGTCYRCHNIIEPMLSDQWFVRMEELAKPAIEAAKTGELIHVPERFEKVYLHWLENIRDWCISRQLWWGHRIPAYYCQDCGEIIVSAEAPAVCSKCSSNNIKQDEDVLDTWFSSALWPFSTLGWPEKTKEMDYFFPNDVLVTGYDIIFFWVVRMVFSSLNLIGEVPFKYVYVHGLVRDEQGRKMSKSLGNGIDPLEVINEYGADALRFMLLSGITAGNDTRFLEERLLSARNFANKLWNASRFVMMNIKNEDDTFKAMMNPYSKPELSKLKPEDRWIISVINDAAKEITLNMDKFELSMAEQKVYDLIWNEYCDWYIEIVKSRLYGDDEEDKEVCRGVAVYALSAMLKMLHPFMPFITEEIWSFLPEIDKTADNPNGFIMRAEWQKFDDGLRFEEDVTVLETAKEAITSIRNIRAEAEALPSKKLTAVILADDDKKVTVKAAETYIKNLANITDIKFIGSRDEVPDEVMSAVINGAEIFIPLDDLSDYNAELERLKKEEKRLTGEVKRIEGKLSNEGFVSKAPENVINMEKEKLIGYKEMLEKVVVRLAVVEKKVNAK